MSQDVENMSFYIFVRAPTGPDPRRAPPGPRAPQGPIPAGPHQGPGEGPGPRAQGPMRARSARSTLVSIYVYGNRISEGLHPRSLVVGASGGHYFDFKGNLIDIIEILVFPVCPI